MKVVLQNVRLSFPDLFVAKQYKGKGKARFSATFLVEKGSETDTLVNQAIKAAAEEAWPGKADANLRKYAGSKEKYCYIDGDISEYDGYKGMMALTSHRNADQMPPKIVDRAKQQLTADSGKPYAGCYVNAIVDIWIQSGDYPGVRATLNVVQFVADGEPFAGSVPNVDDLPDLDTDINDDDDLV